MTVSFVGRVPPGHGHESARPAGLLSGQAHGAFLGTFHARAGREVTALIQESEVGQAIDVEGLRAVIGLHILRPGDEILAIPDEVIHIESQETFSESGLGTGHAGCTCLIVHGAVIGHGTRIRHIEPSEPMVTVSAPFT